MTVEATMIAEEPLRRPASALDATATEDGPSSPWDSLATLPIRPRTRRHAAYSLLVVGLVVIGASDRAALQKYAAPALQRLRRLTHKCDHGGKETLVSPEDFEHTAGGLMPPLNLPGGMGRSSAHYQEPSHMTLCREYVARSDALRQQGTAEAREEIRSHFLSQPMRVRERDEVCSHWDAPHWALMNIFASSVLSTAAESVGITYEHDCHRTMGAGDAYADGASQATSRHSRRRLGEERIPQILNTEGEYTATSSADVDHTTIQQMIPSGPKLLYNGAKLTDADVLGLCRGCIQGFDPSKDNAHDKARVTHHCMLFPGIPEVINPPEAVMNAKGTMERAPCAPGSDGCDTEKDGTVVAKATPLEAALPLIKNRIYHAAVDMAERSHFPDFAPRTGVVLYIHEHSIAINPELYFRHLPPPKYATSLHILVSPGCAGASMPPRNELCTEYVQRVHRYLQEKYPSPDTDVQLKYAVSTAAAFSRMVLSKAVYCPPFTLTCIFAALSKQTNKETVMFELDEEMYTNIRGGGVNVSPISHWITRAGGSDGNIKVVPVSEAELFSDTLGSSGSITQGSTEGSTDGGERSYDDVDGIAIFDEDSQSSMQMVSGMDSEGGMQMVQSVSQRWSNEEDFVFDTTSEKQRRPTPRSINGMDGLDTSEMAKTEGGNGDGQAHGSDSPLSPDEFMVNFDDEGENDKDSSNANSNSNTPPRESRTSDNTSIIVGQPGQSSAAGMQASSGGAAGAGAVGGPFVPRSDSGDDSDYDAGPKVEGRTSDARPVEAGGDGGATWTPQQSSGGAGGGGGGPQRSQARPLDAGGNDAASFTLPNSDDEEGEGEPVFEQVQTAPAQDQGQNNGGGGGMTNFAGGGGGNNGGGGRFGDRRSLDNPTLRGKEGGKADEGNTGRRAIRESPAKDDDTALAAEAKS